MWLWLYSLALFIVGLALLLFPNRIRGWFMPDYARHAGNPLAATSLLVYRLVGAVAILMAAVTAYVAVRNALGFA